MLFTIRIFFVAVGFLKYKIFLNYSVALNSTIFKRIKSMSRDPLLFFFELGEEECSTNYLISILKKHSSAICTKILLKTNLIRILYSYFKSIIDLPIDTIIICC